MTKCISSVLLLLFLVPALPAQTPPSPRPQPRSDEYGPAGAPPPPSRFNYIVPLPSSRTLSPAQLAGKKLFVQRCSVCHLPGNPAFNPVAPLLDGKIIASRGDAAIREKILHGSAAMSGFQYMIESAGVDQIITYLKMLAYDPATRKYSYSPDKK